LADVVAARAVNVDGGDEMRSESGRWRARRGNVGGAFEGRGGWGIMELVSKTIYHEVEDLVQDRHHITFLQRVGVLAACTMPRQIYHDGRI
jgi:hydrogenase maturation factor HypE